MFPFITLTDGVVTLRPFEFGEDNDLLIAVQESIPELQPWMSWANERYTSETALNFIALTRTYWSNGSLYAFAITDAKTGALIGGCSLVTSTRSTIFAISVIGYALRGRGKALPDARHNWRRASHLKKLI